MQNKNETNPNMTSDSLQKISELFLQLKKERWQNLSIKDNNHSAPNELLEKKLQQETSDFLDRHSQEIVNDDDGCLMARFILTFAPTALDEEKFNSLKQLLADKKEHPVLLEIDELIKKLRANLFSFFLSYEANYDKESETFYIDKTNNKTANLIINTEIKRTILDFTERPDTTNSKVKFNISLNELSDKFEIELKKTSLKKP